VSLIQIKNVTKTYFTGENSFNALSNVSLEIKRSEFVSIMGASGSGKSTLMNILGCLDKPTSGEFFLDGKLVNELSSDELAEIRNLKIGFVFQGFNLIPRTDALENVVLPLVYKGIMMKERTEKAKEALNLVGLSGRMHHTPNQLSGGQQQRVAIARAIVNDAPIILADEPTGNLDTKTSVEIMDLFVKLNEETKKTIILVTHENDIAEYSKRIVHFKDGKIISDEVKALL